MGVTVLECHQHILVQSGSTIWPQALDQECNENEQTTQLCQFRVRWQFEEDVMGDLSAIVSAIGDGTAIAMSDGSFKEGRGAVAWTIEGAEATNKVTWACLVPGIEEDHSAFQSKLMGLLGIMLTMYGLQEQSEIKTGCLRVCCNRKSALEWVKLDLPVGATEPHADLITVIHNLRKQIIWKLNFQHVRGHQDQGHPMVLTREATLNVEMDKRAKAKLTESKGTLPMDIPFEGWTCYIGSKNIIKQWALKLREHINGTKLLHHWNQRKRFREGRAKQVDWDAMHKAMTEVPWRRRKWVTKFATGEFAHGENMKHWKFRTISKCPHCSNDPEDKMHILHCPAPTAQLQWQQALQELEKWLRVANTDPKIVEALLTGLQGWYDGIHLVPVRNMLAAGQQNQLG